MDIEDCLSNALKLLHPYMPFITEEIYCTLCPEEESIMISAWPEFTEEWNFAADEEAVETIKEAVRGIRNVRTGNERSAKAKKQRYSLFLRKQQSEKYLKAEKFSLLHLAMQAKFSYRLTKRELQKMQYQR